MAKNKVNPHCPVSGCKTDKPHGDDPIVKALIQEFAPPAKTASWVCAGIAEIRDSMRRDFAEGRKLAWFSRLRHPEELYFRTLYALFIADEKELHHILSGERPNGLNGEEHYAPFSPELQERQRRLLESEDGLETALPVTPASQLPMQIY